MIKCRMEITRFMYPKDHEIESGDFAIFTARVIKHLTEEKPIEHSVFKTVSIKGNIPVLKIGEEYDIILDNPEINKYGTTYELIGVTKEIDVSNKKEVEDFLSTICGPRITKELMKLENPYELLMNKDDETLLKISGIGKTRLEQIYNNLDQFGDKSYAYTKLEPLGISKKLINTMCNKLGGAFGAVEVCFKEPYKLIDKVDGIGFIKADEIASKCGVNNPNLRMKYAILHILEKEGECGRSYLSYNQLINELKLLVIIDVIMLNQVIENLIQEDRITLSNDGNCIALVKYLKLESDIAIRIKEIKEAKGIIEIPDNWRETVKKIEERQGWKHTDEQMYGIEEALKNNIVVIRGLAGTGKSTIVNAISEILKDYTIEMCCLGAKAAQRLREVSGHNAKTIHRLIGLGIGNCKKTDYEVYADIIILDEASMVNGTIFLLLLKAISLGSKVIILGDNGQLNSIGNCSVFNDLINTKKISVVELTKIHRQAEKSAIITGSINIRKQKPIVDKKFIGEVTLGELQDLDLIVFPENEPLLKKILEKFKVFLEKTKDIMEVQIISPTKKKGILSCKNINEEIQKIYNKCEGKHIIGRDSVKMFIGDKVINLKNNYNSKDENDEPRPIYNGSIGILVKIEEKYCVVDFVGIGKVVINKNEFLNLNLAYAISCHSSQGSQWEYVIGAVEMSAYMLLNVEMLYTLITRASKHCSLAIERQALNICLSTVEQNTKQTLLPMFLEII